uniref:Uncharacterized protein n=1 Tax=viral metagenome TaxID=1070528 RepID=A0A6C0IPS6_9ZZZZ
MTENDIICDIHTAYTVEKVMSPCRGKCGLCMKKKVHGYSNPDHVSNPFGYLYLIPMICSECSMKHAKCMWCVPKSKL